MSAKKKSYYQEPRTNPDLLWLAVDLDATIARPVWPDPGIGKPYKSAVRKLMEAVDAGYKIIVHTARPWADYEMIEGYLSHYGVPWHRIVCGKLLAIAYIDDRNISASARSWIPKKGKK